MLLSVYVVLDSCSHPKVEDELLIVLSVALSHPLFALMYALRRRVQCDQSIAIGQIRCVM